MLIYDIIEQSKVLRMFYEKHFGRNEDITYMDEKRDNLIYIMLTDYPDNISKAIKRIGLWEYSHVSISTSNTFPKFFSFVGRKGFRVEEINLHPTFRGTDVPCALFEIPVSETELKNVENRIEQFVTNAVFYKYSMLGLALLYFRITPARKYKYTCISFVLKTLKEQTSLFDKSMKKVCTPNDIKKFFKKDMIFEGPLKSILKLSPHPKLA